MNLNRVRDYYYHFLGEVLWIMDSTRIDEGIAVTAVIAFAVGLITHLSFVSAMLLLTGVQLIYQGINVPKAIEAFKRLTGREGK